MTSRGRGRGRGNPPKDGRIPPAPGRSNWPSKTGIWLQVGQKVSNIDRRSQVGQQRPDIQPTNSPSCDERDSQLSTVPSASSSVERTTVHPNASSKGFIDGFHSAPVMQEVQGSSSAIELSEGVPVLFQDFSSQPIPDLTPVQQHELELRQRIAECRRLKRGKQAERKKQLLYDQTNSKLRQQGEEPMPLSSRPWNRLVHRSYRARLEGAQNELRSLNLASSSTYVPDFLAVSDSTRLHTAYNVDPTEVARFRSFEKVNISGDDDFCTVCQETIVEATIDLLQCHLCKSIFHDDCVAQWLAKYNVCPNCRAHWPRHY